MIRDGEQDAALMLYKHIDCVHVDEILDVAVTKANFGGTALDLLKPPFLDEQASSFFLIQTRLPPFFQDPQLGRISLISFIPEAFASNKEKMLYASSLAILREALGEHVGKEYQFTSLVCLAGQSTD